MIFYRCPHCNRPYAKRDSDASLMGKQGNCNSDIPKGCGKNFIRVKTKEKLPAIKTLCHKCFTVWNGNGLIGTYLTCGENSDSGCGNDYFGFDWLGQQERNNLISNMTSFFSFGLVGSNKQKCPRCSTTSNTDKLGAEIIKGQVVVSNPQGIQEWHDQAWVYYCCKKCIIAWSNYITCKA